MYSECQFVTGIYYLCEYSFLVLKSPARADMKRSIVSEVSVRVKNIQRQAYQLGVLLFCSNAFFLWFIGNLFSFSCIRKLIRAVFYWLFWVGAHVT